jgi:tRNA pseudouridine38-40 synthase
VCAGRTDAGVHATAQVVHFDTEADRPLSAWVRGVNAHLPTTIAVQSAAVSAPDFHARFNATRRAYRYTLYCKPQRHPLLDKHTTWIFQPLDIEAMRAAALAFVGTHDFSSFRSSQCQAASPIRSLERFEITEHGSLVYLDVCGNAFLHHMVRNLVGALLWIGMGKRSANWAADVLQARDRTLAAMTAPAQGLCLQGVDYAGKISLDSWPPVGLPWEKSQQ